MLGKKEIAEMVGLENKLLKKDNTPRKDADPEALKRLGVLTAEWNKEVEKRAGVPKSIVAEKGKKIVFSQREQVEMNILFPQIYAEDMNSKIKRKDKITKIVPEDRAWFDNACKRYDFLVAKKAKCDSEEAPLDPDDEDVIPLVVSGLLRYVRKVRKVKDGKPETRAS